MSQATHLLFGQVNLPPVPAILDLRRGSLLLPLGCCTLNIC